MSKFSQAGETAMKLLSSWEIERGRETNRIELLEGDLTDLPREHAVDVLVVSAFKNNYAEIPETVIGALAKRGLSVAELAERKRMDLRVQFSCWLSEPVPAKYGFRYLLCIESGWNGEPPEITDNIFRALAPVLFTDLANASVAMPLIGSGSMGYPATTMLRVIVTSTVAWMRRGLKLRTLKIVVQPTVAKDIAREFESLKLSDSNGEQSFTILNSKGYDVFISYAHYDKTYADSFVNDLKRRIRSLKIFVDASSLSEGAGWPISVANALDASRKIVVLHSEAYWKSKNCQSEFNAAFARQNDIPSNGASSDDNQIIYPLLLDDVKIPYMFRTMQYVDCRKFDEAKIASASQKFCESLYSDSRA